MQISLKQRSIYPFKFTVKSAAPTVLLFLQRPESRRWGDKGAGSLMGRFPVTSFKDEYLHGLEARRIGIASKFIVDAHLSRMSWRHNERTGERVRVSVYVYLRLKLEREGRNGGAVVEEEQVETEGGSCHYENLRPDYNRREEFYAFCWPGVRS